MGMMRHTLTTWVLVVSYALLAVSGCGLHSQDSPRATLRKADHMLRYGHKHLFVECFDGPEREMERIELAFDAFEATKRFRRVFRKHHGEENWQAFKALGILPHVPPADEQWMDAVHLDESIEARVTVPIRPPGTFGDELVLRDGRWKILAIKEDWAGDKEELEAVIRVADETIRLVANEHVELDQLIEHIRNQKKMRLDGRR